MTLNLFFLYFRAAKYFARTEQIAGVQDMRFQALMPDVLQWLGVKKIDKMVSMSNMKHVSITFFSILS
jgi:GTP cyclohydrolase II